MFIGCASWRNDIAHKGGLFTEYRGDYVVISESGGVIMDVWVLEDVYVESEKNSDGWRFIDRLGQPTNVGGDSKVIRIKDKAELQNYREYHIERDLVPYNEYKVRDSMAGRYWQRTRVKNFFNRNRGGSKGRLRSRRMVA
jgi:hypothetical protein